MQNIKFHNTETPRKVYKIIITYYYCVTFNTALRNKVRFVPMCADEPSGQEVIA